MVNNSMAGSKVEFVPLKSGKEITWYGCGPTVYDAAHMGHARTYVAFDIIRRILNDYFGYQLFMCMNITDIDDKIIKRSNESGKDFASLARYWEGMFWKDMAALNVLLPDVVTRVSEYIPEVLDFIKGIVDNGFAYVSHGSVYFDTQAFRSSATHVYGRMEPYSVNDEARVLEGEGELGIVTQKRSPLDFALWKKAKDGEPSWDSPWGPGRPGWHIECSAMASTILGFPIDIHSGGIDLRFPHHDNELAQSEARYNKPQWVNYFLHAGHLHIKGSKMSKSLKNFITIKECLNAFSPRAIRLLTLMHRWDAPMNYSPDGESMSQSTDLDRTFVSFFGTAKSFLRDSADVERLTGELANKSIGDLDLGGLLGHQNWDVTDLALHEKIRSVEDQVDQALKDNFDTPAVLTALRGLVTDIHVYMKREGGVPKSPLVMKGSRFIFRMLKIFGLTNGDEVELNYVGSASGESQAEANVMDCLSNFRQEIRKTSQTLLGSLKRGGDSAEALNLVKQLLQCCDEVRDNTLVELGIQLEDMPEGPIWKKSAREELLRERERKAAEEDRRRQQKLEAQRAQAGAKAKKEAEARIPPEQYYPTLKAESYASFDEQGIPMTTSEGSPVSKSQRDKMRKFLDKHAAVHNAWLESQQQQQQNGTA